jgi:cytochrome c biogenesis protein CcdA
MNTPQEETVSRHGDMPPFWPPPAGWQPGAGVPSVRRRRAGRVGRFVIGALSTLALLSGGFLLLTGLVGLAASGESGVGDTYWVVALFCLILGLALFVVGVVGLRRLWRR